MSRVREGKRTLENKPGIEEEQSELPGNTLDLNLSSLSNLSDKCSDLLTPFMVELHLCWLRMHRS